MARVVLPGFPHHITQRGNWRLDVFREQADYERYLELLQIYSRRFALGIAGYCLMTNHVHIVGQPHRPDAIARTFKYCHGIYATEFNKKYGKNGHLWQARPFSCVLDEPHAWATLRYVERNPVRAHIVARAEDYPWSSASAHCGFTTEALLNADWPGSALPADWQSRLAGGVNTEEEQRIRECTFTGRPRGDERFVKSVEAAAGRLLAPAKRGPKTRTASHADPTLLWTADEIDS
jgi:putative transposase